MDKDNLGIRHFFTNLTADKLKTSQGDIQQQMLTALCLTAVGLLLTITGLIGFILRLGRFAGFNIMRVVIPLTYIVNQKRLAKISLPETGK
jgi:hypothetical protein